MQKGYVPTKENDASHGWLSYWVLGEPRKTFLGVWDLGGKNVLKSVVTYRCVGCGYLESYAKD
jgi:hypothetical protein